MAENEFSQTSQHAAQHEPGGNDPVVGDTPGPHGATHDADGTDVVMSIGTTADGTVTVNTGGIGVGDTGDKVGFMGAAPITVPAITGSLSTVADAPAKAVLTSIITELVALGLVTDGTS